MVKEPMNYLKAKLLDLPPGRILLSCGGEGRNAVFAAKLGWGCFCF